VLHLQHKRRPCRLAAIPFMRMLLRCLLASRRQRLVPLRSHTLPSA
jgi:hypothetical protein